MPWHGNWLGQEMRKPSRSGLTGRQKPQMANLLAPTISICGNKREVERQAWVRTPAEQASKGTSIADQVLAVRVATIPSPDTLIPQ